METATTEAPQTEIRNYVNPEPNARPSGGGAPSPEPVETEKPEGKAPESVRDSLAAEAKKIGESQKREEVESAKAEAKETEDAPKAEAEAKPQKAGGGEKPEGVEGKGDKPEAEKPEKPEVERKDADHEAPADRRKKIIDAPKHFLPKAKEFWGNVPHPVREEVQRTIQEHEQEIARYREVSERYEAVREYDELARQNGRDLRYSLERVKLIEDTMQANPLAALNMILQEAGPRKPDGSPLNLFEVANFIVQQGQDGYNQLVRQHQQAPQQPQIAPEVQRLQQELAEMKAQMAAKEVIEPFAAQHPRYHELQEDIAFFLESGKIPRSLSPAERLAAAYDMAERINPPSHVEYEEPVSQQKTSDADSRAGNFGGSKSIKSTPGGRIPDEAPLAAGDIRSTLMEEMRKLRRA